MKAFFGIQIDKTLKWYNHTCKVANNISKKIGMMSRIKNFVSRDTLKTVYNCFIQLHLVYGIQLWGGTFDKGLKRVQKLQKKAIWLLTGAKWMAHSEPRLKKLAILRLDDLYKKQVALLTYGCLTKSAPANLQDLFTYRGGTGGITTRSQTGKPLDIKTNADVKKASPVVKASLAFKGPEIWNGLPESIQSRKSKLGHKSQLKQYFLDQYVRMVPCSNVLCADDYCTLKLMNMPDGNMDSSHLL
jgi:hypothetical protein